MPEVRYSREGPCRADGCDRSRHARGYCEMHYRRTMKYGDPSVVLTAVRDPDSEWRCARCEQIKPAVEFPLDPARPGRRYAYCKPCKATYMRDRRTRIIAEQGEEAWQRLQTDRRLRRTYGITLAEYEERLAAQGGGCAVCGTPEPTGNHGRLVVDHDHSTGQVRALLCGRCNMAIGLIDDDPATADSLAVYLRVHRSRLCAETSSGYTDEVAGERPAHTDRR